jgi:hypothetical protein
VDGLYVRIVRKICTEKEVGQTFRWLSGHDRQRPRPRMTGGATPKCYWRAGPQAVAPLGRRGLVRAVRGRTRSSASAEVPPARQAERRLWLSEDAAALDQPPLVRFAAIFLRLTRVGSGLQADRAGRGQPGPGRPCRRKPRGSLPRHASICGPLPSTEPRHTRARPCDRRCAFLA